jgi:hypothetical protein
MKRVSYKDLLFSTLRSNDFCVSIYASNFMEMERLIDGAQLVAKQDLSPEKYSALFSNIENDKYLVESFPVALFLSSTEKMYVPLFNCYEELFVVATSFHIKPLIKLHQRDKDVALLVFAENNVKLFLVNIKNVNLLEVFPFPQNKTDLLKIDQHVAKVLKKEKPLLILSGNNEICKSFKKISVYGYLFGEPLEILQKYKGGELVRHIFKHLEPYFRKNEVKKLERFELAKLKGKVVMDANEILNYALNGAIKTLYISEDKKLWGYLDTHRKKMTIHSRQIDSYDDDILDDISEIVMKNKGTVFTLPQSQMPEKTLMFAILRDDFEKILFDRKQFKKPKYLKSS